MLSNNYFSDCYSVLSAGILLIEHKMEKGCPQGCCCGPGFWIIMYDQVLKLDYRPDVKKVIAFADDLLLVVTGPSESEMELKLNTAFI